MSVIQDARPSSDDLATAISPDNFVTESFDGKLLFAAQLKRVMDVVGASVLLLVILPVLACVAAAVVCRQDGGSLIYRQNRVGRNGRIFRCLKFRTMCPNADDVLRRLLETDPDARGEWHSSHKLKVDPRITPVGRFLRATSLDELPQLWNVLVGDMSLVGPRPVTRAELETFYTKFDGVPEYLSVRPGITGLWQISGRSGTSYEQRVRLDKEYVRNFSVLRDVSILCRTIAAVSRRDGAC